MKNLFTEHPHSISETYFTHLKFALIFGGNMLIGGMACIIHAIFPFIFQKTGSNILLKTTCDFIERMPADEARIIPLLKLIEKKMKS